MENRLNAVRPEPSEITEEAVNAIAREILINPGLAKELSDKGASVSPVARPKLDSNSGPIESPRPMETTYQLGNTELIYNKKPWLGQTNSLPLSVALSATIQAGIHSSAGRYGGGILATSRGLSSAYFDANNILISASTLEGTKYGLGLTTDLCTTAGGIAQLAKFGPRWLAPSLILGGIVGRALVDTIPNEIRTKR